MKKKAKAISFLAAQSRFANIAEQASLNLPERVLWAEVLIEALIDLRRADYRVDALRWIRSNGQSVGSFCWVCHHLSLDCSAVRRSLNGQQCRYVSTFHRRRPKKNPSDDFQSVINSLSFLYE